MKILITGDRRPRPDLRCSCLYPRAWWSGPYGRRVPCPLWFHRRNAARPDGNSGVRDVLCRVELGRTM